jgi:hypothetical protein
MYDVYFIVLPQVRMLRFDWSMSRAGFLLYAMVGVEYCVYIILTREPDVQMNPNLLWS